MKALLLCAGLGTRFRPHTDKIAKPALPFFGVPLAGFGLFYLENAGLTNLAVNTHHLPKTVENAMTCMGFERKYKVVFSHESPQVLGSGGGIKKARPYLQGSPHFVVINGDEVILHDNPGFLKSMVEAHQKSQALVTMLTIDHPRVGSELPGVKVNGQGHIIGLSVKGDDKDIKHNCGVYVYDQRIFDFMPPKDEFHIFKDCLEPAMARGQIVNTFHTDQLTWLDTTDEKSYIESLLTAAKILESESSQAKTFQAILGRFNQKFERVHAPHGLAYVGIGARLGAQVEINGIAVLCPNSQFDQGILSNSAIGTGLHIHEMVALKNQLLV